MHIRVVEVVDACIHELVSPYAFVGHADEIRCASDAPQSHLYSHELYVGCDRHELVALEFPFV